MGRKRMSAAVGRLLAGPGEMDPYLDDCKSFADAYAAGVRAATSWACAIGETLRDDVAQIPTLREALMTDAQMRTQIEHKVSARCMALQSDLARTNAENVRVVEQVRKLRGKGILVRELARIIRTLLTERRQAREQTDDGSDSMPSGAAAQAILARLDSIEKRGIVRRYVCSDCGEDMYAAPDQDDDTCYECQTAQKNCGT